MSAARLYRALLKTAKRLDTQPWRRSLLLRQAPLHPYAAAAAKHSDHANVLYYLQSHTGNEETQAVVREQFRIAVQQAKSKQEQMEAFTHGFDVLRCMRTGTELPVVLPASRVATNTNVPSFAAILDGTASSSGVHRSCAATPATAGSSSSAPWRVESRSASSSLFAAGPESSVGGAALRPMSDSLFDSDPTTSTLGLLHHGQVELQRQLVVAAAAAAAAASKSKETALPGKSEAGDASRDAAIAQYMVCAEEYLKLVAPSTEAAGSELLPIEQSRLKHQQRQWRREFKAALSPKQQVELEVLLRALTNALQHPETDAAVNSVLAQLPHSDATVAKSMLSNNEALNAAVDALYSRKNFTGLLRLQRMRMLLEVNALAYSLSRSSLCKILVAAAVEGDANASMLALRESSWSALTLPSAPATDAVEDAGDDATISAPSSSRRLPSWVPACYSSDGEAWQPRSNLEVEDAPDDMLAQAGDGFGIEQSSLPQPAINTTRPKLTINVRAVQNGPRALSPCLTSLVGTSGGSSLFTPPTPSAQSLAASSISTLAAQQPQPSPPTPLPIIDLWTELSLDSRLMELAMAAAMRGDALAEQARVREQVDALAATLTGNLPLAAAAHNAAADLGDLHESAHDHAKRLVHQQLQQQAHERQRVYQDIDAEQAAKGFEDPDPSQLSVFDAMNSPTHPAPLAFQLWSLLLQQHIPLHHSSTYVQLAENLRSHLTVDHSHSHTLRFKWLRSEMEAFRLASFQAQAHLAVGGAQDEEDNLGLCLEALQRMHAEGFKPPLEAVAAVYRTVLESTEPGLARTRLLQDYEQVIQDLADHPNDTESQLEPERRLTLENVINAAEATNGQ